MKALKIGTVDGKIHLVKLDSIDNFYDEYFQQMEAEEFMKLKYVEGNTVYIVPQKICWFTETTFENKNEIKE